MSNYQQRRIVSTTATVCCSLYDVSEWWVIEKTGERSVTGHVVSPVLYKANIIHWRVKFKLAMTVHVSECVGASHRRHLTSAADIRPSTTVFVCSARLPLTTSLYGNVNA